MKRIAILLVSVGIFMSGCATFGVGSLRSSVEKAISLINAGDVDALVTMSVLPFVFDREILMRAGDVKTLWGNLSENGFGIEGVRDIETSQVTADSYRLFSDAQEMVFFFHKYVEADAYIARIVSNSGNYILLLGKMNAGYPRILGISGPKEQ